MPGTKAPSAVNMSDLVEKTPKDFGLQWLRATNSFEAGDYVSALDIFQTLADEGYVEAFTEIGNILELGGGGVKKDYISAAAWYGRAISAFDDPNAHLAMGRLLFNGQLGYQDFHKAIDHFQVAARGNAPVAQTILGMLFQTGFHVVKDVRKAREIYRKAIGQGYVWPMVLLGSLEAENGNVLRSLSLRVRAAWSVLCLAPTDRRLWNVAKPDERIGQVLAKPKQ